MKSIIRAGMWAAAALSLQSCFFSEEDVFEEPSNERIEMAKEEIRTLLTGAPGGWRLEYYPGGEAHDMGGVVLLLRFEGEDVTVMSDRDVKGMDDADSTRAGETVTSKYSILGDRSTVLSFSTYNSLIHYWSEPKGVLDADGYAGDFEFVVTEATQENITLRGKKHGAVMHMARMADNADWGAYVKACNRVRGESAEYMTLVGFRGGEEVIPSAYSQENVITFSSAGSDGQQGEKKKVSFAYTDKGIRLYEPTTVNGVTLGEFTWNNVEKSFTSVSDAEVQLRYVRPADYVPIEFYTENAWDLSYTYNFGRSEATEVVSFTRAGDSDTLWTKITCSGLGMDVAAVYNHTTGMIEFRTQYLTAVVLTLNTGESINAYMHLCPWNDADQTMYLVDKAGIVSTTVQADPRVLTFTDNGRVSGSDLNGFVFYAFGGEGRDSERLGVLETYNNITLTQRTAGAESIMRRADEAETRQSGVPTRGLPYIYMKRVGR